jgi:hypothetical protein
MGRSRRDSNQEDYSGSAVIRNHVGNKIRMPASTTPEQQSEIHRRCLCGGVQYPGNRQDDDNPVLSAEQRTSRKSQPDVAEHVEMHLFRHRKRLGRSCAMGNSGLQSLPTRKHQPVSKQVMFGEEVPQPLDVVYGRSHEVMMCATEYAQWLQTTIAYVHAQARKHLNMTLKAQKTYYDRKLRGRSFKVREQVLWLRPNVAKLENVWQEPYVVVNKQEEWYYYTLERNGKRRRATANQLRPYYESRIESNIQFGQTRDELENEVETDGQSPPPDAEDAIELANGAMEDRDKNGIQPPLSLQVIV